MLRRQLIFQAFDANWWTTSSLVLVLLAIVMITVLMRYERRLVPRRAGWSLLVLRLTVVGVLFVTLMEPVLTWSLDREETGRIVVALDLSESMGTSDSHANQAEKLRWARALGLIGNPQTEQLVDAWIADYEAGIEPEWTTSAERKNADNLDLLEQGRRDLVENVLEEVGQLSRKQIAERLLNETTSPLIDSIGEVGNVQLMVFAGEAANVERDMLAPTIADGLDSLNEELSDLSAPLSASFEADEQSPVIGVVLLTDGRDNGNNDLTAAAGMLAGSSTPVFPVILGSELRPRDLSIGELDYPDGAARGDVAVLKAVINTVGFEGEQIDVVLDPEDGEPLTKTVTARDELVDVQFELDTERPGRSTYTISTAVREGETREDNNQKSFALNVVSDTVRVLLLDGEARWEFRFLDNALARDENIELHAVLFEQPFLGVLDTPYFENQLIIPADADDATASPFADMDLVIVGDVSPTDLSESAWKSLERFVSDEGGTLVISAGQRHMPLGHRSTTVANLLPIKELRPVTASASSSQQPPSQRGFPLELSPKAKLRRCFSSATTTTRMRRSGRNFRSCLGHGRRTEAGRHRLCQNSIIS